MSTSTLAHRIDEMQSHLEILVYEMGAIRKYIAELTDECHAAKERLEEERKRDNSPNSMCRMVFNGVLREKFRCQLKLREVQNDIESTREELYALRQRENFLG